MDLFSTQENPHLKPLSEVLRPKNLDEVIGQEKTIGSKAKLGQMIRKGIVPSLIIWGPPGTGKTSFALALSQSIQAHFVNINAVDSGAKTLRELGEQGRDRRLQLQQKTLLFVDEIHRFNKAQQDVMLPFVEKGDLILVGATTENPSYELNRALLSRCRVIIFEPLTQDELQKIIHRAESYLNKSISDFITTEAKDFLLGYSDGDARRLINCLEIISKSFDGQIYTIEDVKELVQMNPLGYDKNSEFHYDVISAFIKSIRGSDADAAVYYMARMLDGGEDPVFIARRLIILASEDIGNADPRGISVAIAGLQAVEAIGIPEAAITLAQVTTYLASCPKSNASYMSLHKAKELVEKTRNLPVPLHLRSSRTELSKSLGYGKDYAYPHNHPKAWVSQSYLPTEIADAVLYEPTNHGFEKNIREYQAWLKTKKSEDTDTK